MVYVTRNVRKKRVPGAPVLKLTSEVKSESPKATIPVPTSPKPKKESVADEPKKTTSVKKPKPTGAGKASASPSKPAPAQERERPASGPVPTSSGTDRKEGQLNAEQFRKMSFDEKIKLWKKLNQGRPSDSFITVVRRNELPKNVVLRKDEALARDVIPEKGPKGALYCPYCVTWSKFQYFPYTGYDKCIGCGISTRDWYVVADNSID